MTLDKNDLFSLENDIMSIRLAGSVKAYVQQRKESTKLLTDKLERLLNELKKAEEDGKE